MYDENIKWVSQGILHYKDERFETDGQLRISINTSTKDYKSFSHPSLRFTIQNQYQRNYSFDINTASDLLKSFMFAFNGGDIFKDSSQIIKQKISTQFIIEFKYARNEEKVIKLMIKQGESDFTTVILPVDIFQLVANATKYYVDKYYDICMRQYEAALQGETTELLQQLPSLIKQMPSQILTGNYPDSSAPAEEAVKETEMTIADLDTFIGSEMKNVKVPEIDKEKVEAVSPIESLFVDKFMKGDLRNLENILNNTSSIEEISNKLATDMNMDETLPGITDQEMNSLLYISKILANSIELSWVKFERPIPGSTPALKYKLNKENAKSEHYELAYDLLLLSGYIRTMRRRLEDKIEDAHENKSLFHLKFRCYFDPFYFSFLGGSDKVKLTSIITNRFKYFSSQGVFKEYENMLKVNGCVAITENDIGSFVKEVVDKVINGINITDLHDNLQKQNNFRIPSNSNFNKEQIINEIVPLEIAELIGQDKPDIEVSDEVKSLFKSKVKVAKKKVEKKNHLARIVGTLEKDIPKQYLDDFLAFADTYADKDFDFDGSFPYQEFGDDLIKALYVWKPESNPRIKNSLKYYQTQIENEVMEKQYILAVDDKKEVSDVSIDFSEINWE